MSEKIDIPLDARLKYVERRKQDLADCRTAISKLDFKCLERVGHQIKGNATTFGFDELSTIAIEMENQALKKDVEKLKTTLKKFETYLARLK
ncbi:MAG: Hpt domain-containing protein [Bdellovibrionaceae bacterium]|nr:Hpt domain-containing protein [Bdellovibrio sp.]